MLASTRTDGLLCLPPSPGPLCAGQGRAGGRGRRDAQRLRRRDVHGRAAQHDHHGGARAMLWHMTLLMLQLSLHR